MSKPRIVEVRQNVLKKNDEIARELRQRFEQAGVYVVSLVSSPGAGKTTLLEKTASALAGRHRVGVLVGDLATDRDAKRLDSSGARVQQIITGTVCHLDAEMVRVALDGWNLDALDFLFLENVGNLVCPSSYDLGEDMKVVLISTTEGDDKPLKYPGMFRRSSVMVINKIDLLGSSDFDMETVRKNALSINGQLTIFELSCRTGKGLDQWFGWLKSRVNEKKRA